MDYDQAAQRLQGPLSAIFTPFDERMEVDLDRLNAIAEFQLSQGIEGFFVTGSTGEGLLLSEDERLRVNQHLCEQFGDRATIISHVGHPSTEVAARLASGCAMLGADWIASVAPIYHGTTREGALRHYRQIAAASDLPFMVYSLGGQIDPQLDRVFFDLPQVCGLKYTGSNFYSVQQLANVVDRPVAWMSGFDEQFVAALSMGFQGGIGSTFNFAPQFYAGIFRAFRAGDIAEASRLQAQVNRVTELMVRYENWSYRKAIMRFIGLDCGACRPPYAPLSEVEYGEFAQKLEALDILPGVAS